MSDPTAAIIREARREESAILSDIAFRSKASVGYTKQFMEACQEELTCSPQQIASDRFHVLVFELDGKVIGFISAEITGEHEGSIEGLFVEPDSKGMGVGTRLMNALLDWARQHSFTIIQMQSDPAAVAFYESFGAVHIGQTPSGSIPGRMLPQLVITF